MIVKGYKYDTEQEVTEAQSQIDKYYGIPKKPTSVTRHYTGYEFASQNSPTFYYIVYHESIEVVLGPPTEFEVISLDL